MNRAENDVMSGVNGKVGAKVGGKVGATRVRTALVGALAAAAMTLGACGGDDSSLRDELISELVGGGFTQETAECIVTDVEGRGVTNRDLADPITAEAAEALEAAVDACFRFDDAAGLLGSNEDLRDEIIAGMLEDGSMTAEEAECVLSSVESAAGSLAAAFESDDFDAILDAAYEACA